MAGKDSSASVQVLYLSFSINEANSLAFARRRAAAEGRQRQQNGAEVNAVGARLRQIVPNFKQIISGH